MQISELIKLAKSSGSGSSSSSSLRSGSRIIIKFDINNIRNRCSSLGPPCPPAQSPRLDSLLINKRRLPWQKFRDGPRCLKILRHLSSRAKVKVSHRRSRTWSADFQIWLSTYVSTCVYIDSIQWCIWVYNGDVGIANLRNALHTCVYVTVA
ncbi:LOW QUALITY PROTEIN: uncharacterized protein Dyak_GE11937 [Drosophila yakuba]|uniref:Uncharacterized protein n=1 Tax=Drosophila yakuba TaxID=7245 RepID=B4P4P5_DROYA|nr:LOW QUALITY PROTEIN: uncharacterized protein Dyak_GE11937 [Drosophila yakuba]